MNENLVDFANSFLQNEFNTLLWLSLIGGAVVLGAVVLQLCFKRQLPVHWVYVMWMLVICRFVIFATPESPTSFLNYVKPSTKTQQVIKETRQRLIRQNPFFDVAQVRGTKEESPQASTAVVSQRELKRKIGLLGWIKLVWLAGVIWMLLKLVSGCIEVFLSMRKTFEPGPTMQEQFSQIRRKAKVSPRTRMRISDDVYMPAMVGCFRPLVVIPRWCEEELSNEQLELVLAHELIHVRRRDGLVQLLAHLIKTIHWFNPLIWFALYKLAAARECSCDERVIRLFSREWASRKAVKVYGDTILSIVERASSGKSLNPAFVGGFIGNDGKLIKQRIEMLVKPTEKRRIGILSGVAVMALLIAVGFTSAQTISDANAIAKPVSATPSNEIKPAESNDPVSLVPEGVLIFPNPLPISALRANSIAIPAEEASGNSSKPPQIVLGGKRLLTFSHRIPDLIVENPELITAAPISASEILVSGVALGKANLLVGDENGGCHPVQVEVVQQNELSPKNSAVQQVSNEEKETLLQIVEGKSERIKLDYQIPEIMVEDPEVARANPTSPNEFWVSALKVGETQIWVSDPNLKRELFTIRVIPKAEDGPVAFKVKVFEVSKKKLGNLGLKLDGSPFGVVGKVDSVGQLLGGINPAIVQTKICEKKRADTFMDYLTKIGIASLMDQPVLVAVKGRPTEFLSGGEVPIQVEDANGNKRIEFKPFGTRINFTPVSISKSKIDFQMEAEVTRVEVVDDEGQKIEDVKKSLDNPPRLHSRRLATGVEISHDQTFVVVTNEPSAKENPSDTELVFLITAKSIVNVQQSEIEHRAKSQLFPQPGDSKIYDQPKE